MLLVHLGLLGSVDPRLIVKLRHGNNFPCNQTPPNNRQFANSMKWSFASNGIFGVKSYKIFLVAASQPNNNINVGSLWSKLLPKKCKFFVWTILHNGINTSDIYQARNPKLHITPNQCVLCRIHGESIEHLFMSCSFLNTIWSIITGSNYVALPRTLTLSSELLDESPS